MKKVIILLMVIIVFVNGCTQADKVSHNLSKEADYFNVPRRVTATSLYTGDNLFTMEGYFSINQDIADNQLEIVVEIGPEQYAKHFVKTSEMMCYVVEQLEPSDVNRYSYTLNYNPKMWTPFELDIID